MLLVHKGETARLFRTGAMLALLEQVARLDPDTKPSLDYGLPTVRAGVEQIVDTEREHQVVWQLK
jgi:hypothetical protein